MLSSLAEAAAAFNNPTWLAAAVANAEFLIRELRSENGTWKRSWHETGVPRARHHSLAADLAALVDAFTRLAETTGDEKWTRHACEAANQLLDEFWDPQRGGLFTTGNNGEQLIARQKDLLDNATPSANSTAAVALYRLSAMTGEGRYEQHAHRIMQLLDQIMHKAPSAAVNELSALHIMNSGITEIVIPGNRPDFLQVVRESWRPNAVVLWGEPGTSPLWQGRSAGVAFSPVTRVTAPNPRKPRATRPSSVKSSPSSRNAMSTTRRSTVSSRTRWIKTGPWPSCSLRSSDWETRSSGRSRRWRC
jgi:uncharacterized protein YyaL (SSP411 family)